MKCGRYKRVNLFRKVTPRRYVQIWFFLKFNKQGLETGCDFLGKGVVLEKNAQ